MLPQEYCTIKYKGTIPSWDDGLPLGNGQIGCLIWGGEERLRLSIDKSDLWDCSGAIRPGGDFTYTALQKLVKQKRKRKISKVFDTPYARPTPTKLPAGKILIEFAGDKLDSASLNIAQACARLEAGGKTIECFVHATEPVGFICADRAVAFKVEAPKYGEKNGKKPKTYKPQITQSLQSLMYEKAEAVCETIDGTEYRYFTQKIREDLTYGLFLAVRQNVAAYTVCTADSKENARTRALSTLRAALQMGYAEAFRTHKKWWEQFWGESFITLPNKYFEQKWYMTNYLLGACSREGALPMPLQGVWTADNGQLPPWKGDYHFDLNVQLCYLSYLKANHLSCGKSYIDFLLSLEDKAEEFAKTFFGADGLCLPSVADKNGNALGGWAMYALSPANQAWLCHGMKEYCDYAGDTQLLQERVYPYMKKYAKFLLSILVKDRSGHFCFALSSSPEIHDNRLRAWLKPNSNYDNAMLLRHFKNLLAASKSLHLAEDQKKWESVLQNLQPLAVGKDRVLLLSPGERLKHSHRHFSHLAAIYPLRLLAYTDQNKPVIDATVADLEKLGTKEYCGYSFAWLANLYALQRRGADAANTLQTFWQDFCLPNVFHVNGDYKKTGKSAITYRIFSLEGNFCAADALQNMLMQCDGDSIELFPAVPESWQNMAFDLLGAGGIRVNAVMENGKLKSVTLKSKTDTSVYVRCRDRAARVFLKGGESAVLQTERLVQTDQEEKI